jgi:tetratricopeptide (TPR) repeat protein
MLYSVVTFILPPSYHHLSLYHVLRNPFFLFFFFFFFRSCFLVLVLSLFFSRQLVFCMDLVTDDPETGLEEGDLVVAVQYLPELEALVIVSDRGNILTLDVFSQPRQMQSVGYMTGGVYHAAWSPDQEMCAFVTKNDSILLMTKEWDVLYEASLTNSNDIDDSDDIPNAQVAQGTHTRSRISWRGDGQYFACSSFDGKEDRQSFRVWDRNCQLVSTSETVKHMSSMLNWRPEGSIIASSEKRMVGKRWKHEIIFFERNGLRRREFALTVPEADMIDLTWNADSDLLAVVTTVPGQEATSIELWHRSNYHWSMKQRFVGFSDTVHVRWDEEDPLCLFVVDGSNQLRWFHFAWDSHVSMSSSRTIAVVDGKQLKLTPLARMVMPPPMSAYQIPCAEPSRSVAWNSQGNLAVLSTDTEHTVSIFTTVDTCMSSPPPCSVSIPLRVHGVTRPRLLYWASDRSLVVVNASDHGDEIVELSFFWDDEADFSMANLSVDDIGLKVYHTVVPKPGFDVVVGFFRMPEDTRMAVALASGAVMCYYPASHAFAPKFDVEHLLTRFPSCCAQFVVVQMAGELAAVGLDNRARLYVNDILVSPQCLSLASQPHPEYLAFTVGGRQNAMFLLNLSKTIAENLHPDARADPHMLRFTERGSRIITVIHHESRPRVILQLPRGNLETVCPRALTLYSINHALSQRRFRVAFECMRTSRLDMNLLYDHNPQDLLQHAEQFVTQLETTDYINLFLAALVDSDCIADQFPAYKPLPPAPVSSSSGDVDSDVDSLGGMVSDDEADYKMRGLDATENGNDDYEDSNGQRRQLEAALNRKDDRSAGYYAHVRRRELLQQADTAAKEYIARLAEPLHEAPRTAGKVNVVCRVMRKALISVDADKYLLSILTTYAKQTPPAHSEALQLIASLRQHEQAISKGDHKQLEPAISSTAALKYLIFLADVNDLYNVALGMYDFGLVLLVAQQSQKDPKEYLPFLRSLQAMPTHYQRYSIDMHLGKYEQALKHLSRAGDEHFAECLKLADQYNLHDSLLRLFSLSSDELKTASDSSPQLPNVCQLSSEPELPLTPRMQWRYAVRAYARHVKATGRFDEAADAFTSVGLLEEALDCYKSAGDIDAAMFLAASLCMDQAQRQALAGDVAHTLTSIYGRHKDAAMVMSEHGGDIELAMMLLIKSQEWLAAVHLTQKHDRADLIETHFFSAIMDAADHYLDHIETRHRRYSAAIDRLRIVRTGKMLYPELAMDIPTNLTQGEQDEMQSIASGLSQFSGISSASNLTSLTSASTMSTASSIFTVNNDDSGPKLSRRELSHIRRNRKRAAKKKKKKGNIFEEEDLLKRLCSLVPTAQFEKQVAEVIRCLMLCSKIGKSRELQQRMSGFMQTVVREESTPMPPLPSHATAVQHHICSKWDWPNEVYDAPASIATTSSRLNEHASGNSVGSADSKADGNSKSGSRNKTKNKGGAMEAALTDVVNRKSLEADDLAALKGTLREIPVPLPWEQPWILAEADEN